MDDKNGSAEVTEKKDGAPKKKRFTIDPFTKLLMMSFLFYIGYDLVSSHWSEGFGVPMAFGILFLIVSVWMMVAMARSIVRNRRQQIIDELNRREEEERRRAEEGYDEDEDDEYYDDEN